MNWLQLFIALSLYVAQAAKLYNNGANYGITEVVGAELHVRQRSERALVDRHEIFQRSVVVVSEAFPLDTGDERMQEDNVIAAPDDNETYHEIDEPGVHPDFPSQSHRLQAKRKRRDACSSPATPLVSVPTPLASGDAWFDTRDTGIVAQRLVPRYLRDRTVFPDGHVLTYSLAYSEFKDQLFFVFDYDQTFDGEPNNVFVTVRPAKCTYVSGSRPLIISVSGLRGPQGWPSVAFSVADRMILVVFLVVYKGTYVLASQRISAEWTTSLRRFGTPVMTFYVRDSAGIAHDVGAPSNVIARSDGSGYVVAVPVFYEPTWRIFALSLSETGKRVDHSVVFGDPAANFSAPYLVYDPIEENIYVVAVAEKLAMERPDVVIKGKLTETDEWIIVVSKRTLNAKPIHKKFNDASGTPTSDYLVVLGSTNQKPACIRAAFDETINMLMVTWDRDNSTVICQNFVIISKQRIFVGGEPIKRRALEDGVTIQHPVSVYIPSFKRVTTFWEEKKNGHWFIGGTHILPGSLGMFVPSEHQSHADTIYFKKAQKLFVTWKNHQSDYNIPVYGQCVVESERDISKNDLTIGQCNSLFWIPQIEKGQLSAVQVGKIPTSAPIDFSLEHGKLVWYEDYAIRWSSVKEPNVTHVVVSNLESDPGVIVADWQCGMLYFTNREEQTIEVARLDQQDLRKVIATEAEPDNLAVNDGPDGQTLFWEDTGTILTNEPNSDEDDTVFASDVETRVGNRPCGEKTKVKSLKTDGTEAFWASSNSCKKKNQALKRKKIPELNEQRRRRRQSPADNEVNELSWGDEAIIKTVEPTENEVAMVLKDPGTKRDKLIKLSKDFPKKSQTTDVRNDLCEDSKLKHEKKLVQPFVNPCCCNNGGCGRDQICFPTGNGGHRCDCRDGYLVVGTSCVIPGLCTDVLCHDNSAADNICWGKRDVKQFIVIGKATSRKEVKDNVRFTLRDVKILYGPSSLSKLESLTKKKKLYIWIQKPLCCFDLQIGGVYIFSGRLKKKGGKSKLDIPNALGLALPFSKELRTKIKEQLPCKR